MAKSGTAKEEVEQRSQGTPLWHQLERYTRVSIATYVEDIELITYDMIETSSPQSNSNPKG